MNTETLEKLADRFNRIAEIMAVQDDVESRNIAIGYDRCKAEVMAILAGYSIPESLAFRESWQFLSKEKPCKSG